MDSRFHPLAGTRPKIEDLVTQEEMKEKYFNSKEGLLPVKNGTSGHRGKTGAAFSETHVAAMTQALADIKQERGAFGPTVPSQGGENLSSAGPSGSVILGKDVRFTSDFAQKTAAEVFAANGMKVVIQKGGRSTPTPVVSHEIISRNNGGGNCEGVIITASHNPPEDAGYKSNGADGGPNTRTAPVDELAAGYLKSPEKIKRVDYEQAVKKGLIEEEDFLASYVAALGSVIDIDVLKGISFGATSLGGSAHGYYEAVNERYGTKIQVVLPDPDPASKLRTYDWDGKLRGDPSSYLAMKALDGFLDKLKVPFIGANDNDADRFGGVDSTGVLNPNHVLCVVFDYLSKTRGFSSSMGLGRTIGSTHMLDLIAQGHKRAVQEVNVGFKWYVEGLTKGKYVLAGEESAGLSFPKLDGSLWVTEKDGIAAVLLLMEIVSRTGKEIGTLYSELEQKYGPHQYERLDTPATPQKKERLKELSNNPSETRQLLNNKKISGRSIERVTVGDGVKVVLEGGVWVLKRASGTENIIKDYREERGDSLDTVRKASLEIDAVLGLSAL
ncbi:MAG: phosphoglucomutase, alpha-D-glucose phosphate-specific [Nitrospinota bacterium]